MYAMNLSMTYAILVQTSIIMQTTIQPSFSVHFCYVYQNILDTRPKCHTHSASAFFFTLQIHALNNQLFNLIIPGCGFASH